MKNISKFRVLTLSLLMAFAMSCKNNSGAEGTGAEGTGAEGTEYNAADGTNGDGAESPVRSSNQLFPIRSGIAVPIEFWRMKREALQ